jgi:hypothetical protein
MWYLVWILFNGLGFQYHNLEVSDAVQYVICDVDQSSFRNEATANIENIPRNRGQRSNSFLKVIWTSVFMMTCVIQIYYLPIVSS